MYVNRNLACCVHLYIFKDSIKSVLSLHGVAPGAVLEDIDVIVPVVSEGTHVAELARDGISLDERVTRNNAWFPTGVALRAMEGSFIQAIELAVLAASGGQRFFSAVHVHFKNPITDLITLSSGQEIFLRESNLVRRGNISIFKVLIVRDSVVFGILNSIVQIDVPAIPQMLSVYKTITIEVLATINEIEMQILREMLQKLVKNLEQGAKNTHYHEFHKYLMVVHLLLLKGECGRKNLPRVASALATSLLRYTKDIRADQAFLDAGNANRRSGANDMAYIFFNRYIDLYDAIEDPENNGISDNQDFEDTDIPSPYEIALPEKNLLSATERDEIRDWVLEVNMDGTEKSLPTRCCEYC
jgi:hypothetical protein